MPFSRAGPHLSPRHCPPPTEGGVYAGLVPFLAVACRAHASYPQDHEEGKLETLGCSPWAPSSESLRDPQAAQLSYS